MPDLLNHSEYIRIRNLEDSKLECFTGLWNDAYATNGGAGGGGGGNSIVPGAPAQPIEPISPGEIPVTPAEKKAFDLKAAWTAQQKLIGTLVNFLSSLEPGANTEAGNLVADYAHLLETTKSFSASLDAFQVNREALAELPVILNAIDRKPSKELIAFDEKTDDLFTKFNTWIDAGMSALYTKETAQAAVDAAKLQLAAATTEGEVTTAEAELLTSEAELAAADNAVLAADSQLPAVIPIIDTLDISLLIGAIATLNPAAIAVIVGKIILKTLLSFLIRWVEGKLTGKKPAVADLQPIVDALRDIAIQEKTISFGDNASLHTKAEVLQF
jgi:hypothetical protein